MSRDGDYIGEWYLPVDDGSHRLYVLERGAGPVVLSIHGGPGHDHGYLRDALAHLEESYRVVYFDQRGSLRSPMPLERVGFDAIVDDLAFLAEELDSAPVRLLAHSMGCVIAAAAVARHPDRFAEVVLVSPGPLRARHPMFPPSQPRQEVTEELARRGLEGELRSAREKTWAWRIRFAGANLFHVERWTELAGGGVFHNAAVGDAVRSGFPAEYDFIPELQAHSHAVTVLVGDHDFVDPGGEHARAAVGGSLGAFVVPRAGHSLWIDQPAQFAELTTRALAPQDR